MSSNNLDILNEAIARNAGVVFSLPSGGQLRHHKSRFLGAAPDAFWIESAAAERAAIDALVASRAPAGLSFKGGSTKVIFATPALRIDPAFRVNEGVVVQAVLMATPADVKVVQRRASYRVLVQPGSELSVRVWRIFDHAVLRDRPLPSQSVKCVVHDLSLGGMGVTFHGEKGDAPKVMEGDRLRIEVSWGGMILLLDGRVRKPTPGMNTDSSTLRTGVAFKPLEYDLEGRQAQAGLTRIIGMLQREEVRRHRLAATATPTASAAPVSTPPGCDVVLEAA